MINSLFADFPLFSGDVAPEFYVDFMGIRVRSFFWGRPDLPATRYAVAGLPPVDEEYFEWLDLLESISESNGPYTFVELGAGYGRWCVRAALAARQRGIDSHLVSVEAEPTHCGWIPLHMRDNGIDPADHTILNAAVASPPGEVLFYVDGNGFQPGTWYGQHPIEPDQQSRGNPDGTYLGLPAFRHANGYRCVTVRSVTLSEILAPLDSVDLIDMDVQGGELSIIEESIDVLTQKAKRLHVGTHSREIEAGLRSVLRGVGWACVRDYPCSATTNTDYGPVTFEDGVQSWISSR